MESASQTNDHVAVVRVGQLVTKETYIEVYIIIIFCIQYKLASRIEGRLEKITLF
jgi:hypothetical protein